MTSKLKRKHKRLSANSRDDLRFVKLDYFLLKCEAFREISGGAFKLYLKVRERYNGLNNGTISFSVREAAEKLGVMVFNKPQSLRDCNEKIFATHFPQCMPPLMISSDAQQIKGFLKMHLDIVLKPLDGMGGASIFKVSKNDLNINVIIETLTNLVPFQHFFFQSI